MDLRQSSTIQLIKPINPVNFLRNKVAFSAIDLQGVMTVLLALTTFAQVVSVSLKSVFIALTSVVVLYHLFISKRREMFQVFITPWFIAAMLFFLTILIGCLISPADKHTQLDFIHKYSKLFYLPLLALGFQDKQSRFWAIHAFLLGMLITLVCSELKVFGFVKMHGLQTDFGEVFYNHIVTGYFMAFAAFLAAIYAVHSQGKGRIGYVLIALLFSYHTLFVSMGKTGYLMLVILLLIFLFCYVRQLSMGLLILVSALLLMYQSPLVKLGIEKSINQLQNYQQGNYQSSYSPVGHRLQFHKYAENLFLRSPLFGLGTGAFSYYFSVENPVPVWRLSNTPNAGRLMEPHGEYWLIAAEHGLVGLAVFFFFIITLFYETYKTDEMRVALLGLLITFLVGCCSDGFLLLTGPGYFLIIFAAMGFGESFAGRREQFAKRYILNREY